MFKHFVNVVCKDILGRRGYRAPSEIYCFIGVIRSATIRRKRFVMLASQQNVPRMIVMQISALFLNNLLFNIHRSILHINARCKVSMPIVPGSTIIARPFLNLLRVSLACYANSKQPALPKMGNLGLYLSQYCFSNIPSSVLIHPCPSS